MANMVNGEISTQLEGKYAAIVVCWLLGNGCLFSWNSMLTIEDYYIYLFPVSDAYILLFFIIHIQNVVMVLHRLEVV
ncbi:hypothetical protein VNO80_01341 [Phaseolus coccineus]|uniref:Uncharacterized protein n=1 Tax=Phaseolus coccineus TaxID=3886 RepID=A0AAN9RSQ0_PHACN